MPLLPGKKNIGRNIETEEAAGKPRRQAVAIALSEADRTGAGDDLGRALALKRHEEGLTKSQDGGRRMRDREEVLPVPVKSSGPVPMPSGEDDAQRYAPVGDAEGTSAAEWERLFAEAKTPSDVGKLTKRCYKEFDAGVAQINPGQLKRLQEDAKERLASNRTGSSETKAGRLARQLREQKGTGRLNDADRADAGQAMREAEAAEKAGDPKRAAQLYRLAAKRYEQNGMIRSASYRAALGKAEECEGKAKDTSHGRVGDSGRANGRPGASGRGHGDRTRVRDASGDVVSGSEPADHMRRGAFYEVGGDRARALDSYRAAAAGYRRAGDGAGLAKATDGIAMCQARLSAAYDHPAKGRVKVCDSADQALRVAVERTRSGEAVRIDGNKVSPDRGRATDAKPANAYEKRMLEELKREHGAKYPDELLLRSVRTGREPWSLPSKANDADKAQAWRVEFSDGSSLTAHRGPGESGGCPYRVGQEQTDRATGKKRKVVKVTEEGA